MNTIELLAEKYGDVDPLAGVADENRAEAEKIIRLWSGARRGDLRTLASAFRESPPEGWKHDVYRIVIGRLAATSPYERHRIAALAALATLDPDFADANTIAHKRRRGRMREGRNN